MSATEHSASMGHTQAVAEVACLLHESLVKSMRTTRLNFGSCSRRDAARIDDGGIRRGSVTRIFKFVASEERVRNDGPCARAIALLLLKVHLGNCRRIRVAVVHAEELVLRIIIASGLR